MTPEHITRLPLQTPIYIGRLEFVVNYAIDKNVLHLGCVDQGVTRNKFEQGNLLHENVYKVARSLWGVDNDEAGINWMKGKGYPNLYTADLENLSNIREIFSQNYDLILITEVIEHLANPGRVLECLHDLFSDNTEMIITVPNSTSLTNLLQMVAGKELVHPDHNYWFSFSTLNTLLHKHGYEIIKVALYSQFDYQKPLLKYFYRKILGLFNQRHRYAYRENTNIKITRDNAQKNIQFPRIGAWIKLVIHTHIYRYLLKRNPFFADGLIFIVRRSE